MPILTFDYLTEEQMEKVRSYLCSRRNNPRINNSGSYYQQVFITSAEPDVKVDPFSGKICIGLYRKVSLEIREGYRGYRPKDGRTYAQKERDRKAAVTGLAKLVSDLLQKQ